MITIAEILHFYNMLGYIFRYELDKEDRSVKNLVNRMIDENVSEGEKNFIKKKVLKEGVTKQRAPYKITLTDKDIHIYSVQNNVTRDSEFSVKPYFWDRVFKNGSDKVIFFLNEDYIIMDPVGFSKKDEFGYERILGSVHEFYRDIFLNLFGYTELNCEGYTPGLADIFASLFIIQTLDTLEKDKFVEAFNYNYVKNNGKEIWDICNAILDTTDSIRGIPYIDMVKSVDKIQDMITEYIIWKF